MKGQKQYNYRSIVQNAPLQMTMHVHVRHDNSCSIHTFKSFTKLTTKHQLTECQTSIAAFDSAIEKLGQSASNIQNLQLIRYVVQIIDVCPILKLVGCEARK